MEQPQRAPSPSSSLVLSSGSATLAHPSPCDVTVAPLHLRMYTVPGSRQPICPPAAGLKACVSGPGSSEPAVPIYLEHFVPETITIPFRQNLLSGKRFPETVRQIPLLRRLQQTGPSKPGLDLPGVPNASLTPLPEAGPEIKGSSSHRPS